MDNHQFYNAQQAVQAQGGWLMEEKDFTSHSLAALLLELISAHEILTEAAANIRTIAIPDASLRLANLVTLTTA
jgi:UDP-N-acetylglucosamine:LPS N-acetylglucosamine transferase